MGVIKLGMGWFKCTTRVQGIINAHKIVIMKLRGKRPLVYTDVDGPVSLSSIVYGFYEYTNNGTYNENLCSMKQGLSNEI
jgi:hypothetical protein